MIEIPVSTGPGTNPTYKELGVVKGQGFTPGLAEGQMRRKAKRKGANAIIFAQYQQTVFGAHCTGTAVCYTEA